MVSTRNHPRQFPPPDASPTKQASPTKTSPTKRTTRASSSMTSSMTSTLVKPEDDYEEDELALAPRARRESVSTTTWSHTPSQLTLWWLLISLPLVIWDTIYMLGRPYTMPGGWLHKPFWQPYELYGRVDLVYGLSHFTEKGGWGPTQSAGNAVETAMYLAYVWIVYTYGREEPFAGRGAPKRFSFGRRKVVGTEAALAVLLCFATAVMTFWKTVLYCEWRIRPSLRALGLTYVGRGHGVLQWIREHWAQ